MIIQQLNRDDPERVWVAVTNRQGATITTHYPVHKFLGNVLSLSIDTNEAAITGRAAALASQEGSFIGLADADIPDNDVGLVQIYGYHESTLISKTGQLTIRPGHPLGPGNAAVALSLGLTSTAAAADKYGPVIALDTISLPNNNAVAGHEYAHHVFIRAM